jgi:PPE-repeat protein
MPMAVAALLGDEKRNLLMCFGRVPPEIDSGRVHYGSGSGSMVAAANAWDRPAADLYQTATSCRAVTSKPAQGPAATAALAIGQAMARYAGWLDTAATEAGHAATQTAAATAHEPALAALVHPEVINTNRARLLSLATTNCLGQVSPIIADTDAEYERMWVNDAEAMYAYARASADAAALTPFKTPHLAIDPAKVARQGADLMRSSRALTDAPDLIAAGRQVMAAIPTALQAMSSSPQTTLDVHLSSVTSSLSKLSSLCPSSEVAVRNLNSLDKATMLIQTLRLMSSPKQGHLGGAAFAAGFGRGISIGALSVPPRWVAEVTTNSVTEEAQRIWFRQPIHLVQATGAQLARQADCARTPETDGGD